MNSFRFNQFALATLATVFVMFGASLVSEAIFHAEAPEKPGYIIAAAEPAAGGETAAGAEAPAGAEPVSALLASADLAAGEGLFKKCASCHTWEDGGANKVGPNLWAVVGRPIASHAGFSYSAALKAYAEGGKAWDFEELNGFLWNPKKHVAGTAMGFAGLKNVQERANLIAWMNTHNASPLPLPTN